MLVEAKTKYYETKQHLKHTRTEYVSSGFKKIYFLPMHSDSIVNSSL